MGEEIELTLKDIVSKLPESDRAEAEKVIGEAVAAGNILAGVDSQEKAFELIKKTPILKSAFDAEISNTVKNHDDKFIAEKLPKLVDARVQELTGPEKDPIKLELAQIKSERAAEKAEAQKAKQLAIALKAAADEKIPADDIERFLGEDDKSTAESVKAYAARIKAFRDNAIEESKKSMFGNIGKPNAGMAPAPGSRIAQLQDEYNKLQKAGNREQADRVYVAILQEQKKPVQ